MLYNECWRSRNTIYYSKEVQIKVLAEWSLNMREFAMQLRGNARRYVEAYPLQLNQSNIRYIKDWIKNIQHAFKYKKEFDVDDIRKFMS